MRSTSGTYIVGIDHLRAIAILLIFCWHFIGVFGAPGSYAPGFFLFSIFNEGHTGVALFMTISGFIYAKLIGQSHVKLTNFWFNRALRLLPMLLISITLVGIIKILYSADMSEYIVDLIQGLVASTLPNGGWAITVEFHFYAVLPLLILIARKWRLGLWWVVAFGLALRTILFLINGHVQELSYWTLIGRLDQFVIGMLAFRTFTKVSGKIVLLISFAFLLLYWKFDQLGGFWWFPTYPSPSSLWVILPTIEGLMYGTLIAWYVRRFTVIQNIFSKMLAAIGTYSYSIFVIHYFLYQHMARTVNDHVISLANFYVNLGWALISFALVVPLGYLGYRYVESPLLRYRKKYVH